MITDETIETRALQQQTEAEYDATVRADIELFRSHAEKFVAGEIDDDQLIFLTKVSGFFVTFA